MASLRKQNTLVTLLFAWLSWLNAAAAEPKVLCFEGETEVKIESALDGCCGLVDSGLDVIKGLAVEGDCGDCEDMTYELIAKSHRDRHDTYNTWLVESCQWHASTFGLSPAQRDSAPLVETCHPATAAETVRFHILPGYAPLIC